MAELSRQDLVAIQDVHERWIRAELTGNPSKVIDLCTEDVCWRPPNSPPLNGKDAIVRYLAEYTVELKDIKVKDVVIQGNGSVAYLTSYYHTWFKLPDDGKSHDSKVHESRGAHLWILRKTGNGSWRVAIVSWSYWQPRHE